MVDLSMADGKSFVSQRLQFGVTRPGKRLHKTMEQHPFSWENPRNK
jgi:hypothetical protein